MKWMYDAEISDGGRKENEGLGIRDANSGKRDKSFRVIAGVENRDR